MNISSRARLFLSTTALAVALSPGAAFGAPSPDYVGTPPPSVDPTTSPAPTTTTPITTVTPDGRGGELPFTGADVAQLTALGLGAIGLGTVLVRRRRADAGPTHSRGA